MHVADEPVHYVHKQAQTEYEREHVYKRNDEIEQLGKEHQCVAPHVQDNHDHDQDDHEDLPHGEACPIVTEQNRDLRDGEVPDGGKQVGDQFQELLYEIVRSVHCPAFRMSR